MKKCFKCEEVKDLSQFYRHARMADGHFNKCKNCARNDASKHRIENIDKIREYDRERGKNKERIKASSELTKIWRAEDKRRQKAHDAVYRAVKNGKLIRQPCCRCGEQKAVAHHEDYDKPLDVMWLCEPCHKQRHKELRQL